LQTVAFRKLDLTLEKQVQDACLKLAEAGLLQAAHDCSDGGLAVAVAECCFSSLGRDAIGAVIELDSGSISAEALLFSETPSRIVIGFAPENLEHVREIVADAPFQVVGKVAGSRIEILIDDTKVLTAPIASLEGIWNTSLEKQISPA
jgi:phosphoribosylformylglycinamidine synthase